MHESALQNGRETIDGLVTVQKAQRGQQSRGKRTGESIVEASGVSCLVQPSSNCAGLLIRPRGGDAIDSD
jgi:hypothetical protein